MRTSSTKNEKITLKAVILAGGRSRRLSGHIDEKNKCMLKFGGKPLIEYSLENAIKSNVKEIIVVVGHFAEQIINSWGNVYKGTPIKYVIQLEQHGLVHAIECSKNVIGDSDFILFLGDEFFISPNHRSLIDVFSKEKAFAVCGVIKVNDKKKISKTYSILFDHNSQRILRLIEKPKNPLNNFMGTGNIVFKNEILNYINITPINQQRGEKELPDLVQCAIDDGKKVFYNFIASTYVNVNTPKDTTVIKKIISSE